MVVLNERCKIYYLLWHHHAFGGICSRRYNWKSAPNCYASPLTGAGAWCQERQVRPQRHERGTRLASAFQTPKSVWVQPDSWPTPETSPELHSPRNIAHLRGSSINLESSLEIMIIILSSWKPNLTSDYVKLGMKHQSNGHLVTHECGSDSSQRLLAWRISIPDWVRVLVVPISLPRHRTQGHKCSIWLQCQSQNLSKFLLEAIPNSVIHKFAQTLLKLHLYIQPRSLLEIMSFRRLPAVLNSTSVSYNNKKKELGVKTAERLMLLPSRNTFMYGKWTIQQFGTTRHLSSNHELGELDDFKCIVWRKSINMCLWKQELDKGIISVRIRT